MCIRDRFHCAKIQRQGLGDLLIAELVDLPQDEHLPVLRRKGLEPRLDLLAQLLALRRFLGGGRRVRYIQGDLLVVERGTGGAAVPALPPQQVHTGVGGQPIEPLSLIHI